MLGIRHYKNTAIDLFSGEMRWFYSELAVVPNVAQYAPVSERVLELPAGPLEGWFNEATEWASKQGGHHLAIAGIGSPDVLLGALKNRIDAGGLRVERVTFVVSDLNIYEQYQKALFSIFPEGESSP